MSQGSGSPCEECSGETFVSAWGDVSQTQIVYCVGCSRPQGKCNC